MSRSPRLAWLLLAAPALLAASAPVVVVTEPLDVALQRAEAEAAAAEAEVRKLEAAAQKAGDEASRLRAEQAAAAQAIGAAEARISASDAQLRLVAANLQARREALRREQQPIASLLAGLGLMARRPPLLTIADRGGTEEFVRVRLLLDATLPVIRRRTANLSARLAEEESLERAMVAARSELVHDREQLDQRRQRFAALEARAIALAEASGSEALGAGDVALASGEQAERLRSAAERQRHARRLAGELAKLGPAPSLASEASPHRPPLSYRLPAPAAVVEGLGEISDSGIRSRGLTLATARGAEVIAPAAGIIRFSGPFHDHDGVVIIDHGNGWMSQLVNIASDLKPGTRVRAGQRLGRALGPLGVELSRNGQHRSPALIAGSSGTLSNRAKGG